MPLVFQSNYNTNLIVFEHLTYSRGGAGIQARALLERTNPPDRLASGRAGVESVADLQVLERLQDRSENHTLVHRHHSLMVANLGGRCMHDICFLRSGAQKRVLGRPVRAIRACGQVAIAPCPDGCAKAQANVRWKRTPISEVKGTQRGSALPTARPVARRRCETQRVEIHEGLPASLAPEPKPGFGGAPRDGCGAVEREAGRSAILA